MNLPRIATLALLLFSSSPGTAFGAATDPSPPRFAIPQPDRVFTFPRDHGSHPEFRIEWWYVTGHLWDGASNRFGFQATFFRRTAPPPREAAESTGTMAFGTGHLHLAHIALLDGTTGRFRYQERLNRDGWDAGSSTDTLHVWNGNWSLAMAGDQGPLDLRGTVRGDAALDLTLRPVKPLVVFGTNGVSRKGAAPAAASHYLTFPRLDTSGTVAIDGVSRPVKGLAWMDHEFSSSQLDEGQVGWDWASIQLTDGREIMAYRMRRKDGTADPYSTLAWIDPEGRVTQGGASTFVWEPLDRWRSPRTGVEYPLGVRLATRDPISGQAIELRLEPLSRDQELAGTIGGLPYWEGACRVIGTGGRELGWAYVELAGYAGDLAARVR